jgi:hypothetical protein
VDSRHTDHGIVNCMHIGYSGWVIRGPHNCFQGNSPIALGATLIRSIDRLLKETENFCRIWRCKNSEEQVFLSLYPNKIFLAIASGATPIGSVGCAPYEITDYESYEVGAKAHCWIPFTRRTRRHKLLDQSLPSGGVFNQPKIMHPEDFGYWNSQTRLKVTKNIILELRHRDKTWMPWL